MEKINEKKEKLKELSTEFTKNLERINSNIQI
jgi:hypothetical protein